MKQIAACAAAVAGAAAVGGAAAVAGPAALAGSLEAAEPTAGNLLFTQNCALCHQSGALGVAGSFPRLAGRVGVISSNPAGRAYLIDVLTYGMVGTVTVDNAAIMGLMPPFAQLPPDQIAAVLSYVQTLGGQPAKPPPPFTAGEVVAARARPQKAASDVLAERKALEKAKIIP